ncbi:Carboxylic ester hydrolase [Mycena indigotica]|uniref:Carboxylic ester hydrolase n=1 Tax=Mycena indigotica TaxID=2126181 RepID=A0A8H6S9X1_9AGAR|nr:Carboxylic ester hydrolase [Mycena indigotica]KAF7295534.1 Carboxylic ester hydrolase [Mycena indigotica]
MVVAFALVLAVVAPLVGAVPLTGRQIPGLTTTTSVQGIPAFPAINTGLLCQLPMLKPICSRIASVSNKQVNTPIGTAQGVSDGSGVTRFAVRYASAARWSTSTIATKWELPNGATNASALPLACPQPNVDSSAYTEDCLSMVLYVPTTLKANSGVPTLVWIHGGSFIAGSATGPGLDGSKLAVATNSIVAVMQYRLGALGFMAPNGATNLAVKDTINALTFLGKVVPSFGGDAKKITLSGQSAGAGMIRALLAAPSASSLFQSSIMQSDPINYGFLNVSTQNSLQSTFNTLTGCTASNTACQKSLSVAAILNAQVVLSSKAQSIDPSTGVGEPIRPVRDGSLITTALDLTSGSSFPSQSKPLLLTNVKNEAGPTIFGMFTSSLPNTLTSTVCDGSLGPDRTSIVSASPFYDFTVADIRTPLETLGSDYMWRCPTWSLARQWTQHGGKAYVGQFVVGATYPSNNDVAFCVDGAICHEDDIYIVFGTTPSPTAAQTALTTEIQARYKAFLTTGAPNAPGLSPWPLATTSSVHPHQLGGAPTPSGEVPVGACDPAFWGQAVGYDYQVYGI